MEKAGDIQQKNSDWHESAHDEIDPQSNGGFSVSETQMAPVLGIGGLLSVKTQWHYYRPLLSDPNSPLGPKERFLPIPDRGLSSFPEMYGQLEEDFVATQEKLEEKVVLVGHSLGGLMAIKLGLEHPDKTASVVSLAGIQEGIRSLTPTGKLLKWMLKNPPEAENLHPDSDLMQEHKKKIAAEWSPDTSLHLRSPTFDHLIPLPQGLCLELPDGQQPSRKVVGPPGMGFLLRRISDMPRDVDILPSLPTGHEDMAISLAVIRETRRIRRDEAEGQASVPAEATVRTPSPLAAAA